MTDRSAYQRIFSAANSRLHDLPDERCREVELAAVRALKVLPPRPPMLRELLRRMKEEPAGPPWKDRCHHTMRRLFAAMLQARERPDQFQVAINGYLDGQAELSGQWLTLEVLLRPWGAH
jgi:hypothetical protein